MPNKSSKKIMFCEGKNDTYFLTEILKLLRYPENKIAVYDQYERKKFVHLKTKETELISSFREKSSPFTLLIKSEAGLSKIFKLYSEVCLQAKSIMHIILWDLDGKKRDNNLNKLNEKLVSRKLSVQCEKKLECDPLSIINGNLISLHDENKIYAKVVQISFLQSLEYEAKIRQDDNESKKQEKIKNLTKKKKIKSIFNEILNT